MIYFK